MILVDTSVWVDHLRSHSSQLAVLLEEGLVYTHPADLREAVIASAKITPPRRSLWWAGAGLGAALAGAAAGAVTVGVMAPRVSNELTAEQMASAATAFGDLDEGVFR